MKETPDSERLGIRSRWLRCVCYGFVVVAVVRNAIEQSLPWFGPNAVQHSRDIAASVWDYRLILSALRKCPTFPSTLIWWHGMWAHDEVPFWRPLTSLGFWLELHAFGADRFDRWQLVSFFSHLLFVLLLALFVQRMSRSWGIAALTALLFAGNWNEWVSWLTSAPGLIAGLLSHVPASRMVVEALLRVQGLILGLLPTVPSNYVVSGWVYQQEFWVGWFEFGALICSVNGFWGATVACVGLSICCKESGWLCFPQIFAAILTSGRPLRVPWRPAIAMAVVVVILIALRVAAGPEVLRGYHIGQNINWWTRWSIQALGAYFNIVLSPNAGLAILAALIFFLIIWKRQGLLLNFGLLLGGLVVCVAIHAKLNQMDFAMAFDAMFDPADRLSYLLKSLLWLGLFYPLLLDVELRRKALSPLVMAMIQSTPLLESGQVVTHNYYLITCFQCWLVALAVTAFARRVVNTLPDRVRRWFIMDDALRIHPPDRARS